MGPLLTSWKYHNYTAHDVIISLQAAIWSVRRAPRWTTSGTVRPWTSHPTLRPAARCSGGSCCVWPPPGASSSSASSKASTPWERCVDVAESEWRHVLSQSQPSCSPDVWPGSNVCSFQAVYVTATFPYLVLTIFLIRGLTLPGAMDGLRYLFTPDVGLLTSEAAWCLILETKWPTVLFFILHSVEQANEPSSVARCCHPDLLLPLGGLWRSHSLLQLQSREVRARALLKSHFCICEVIYKSVFHSLSIRNNCEKDALMVGIINSATSLYASISVFSILGFKATSNYHSCLNECVCTNPTHLHALCFPSSQFPTRILFLYLICRNILALTNKFEIPDQNMTIENYDKWFDHLNNEFPEQVKNMSLRICDLNTFLDQVFAITPVPRVFLLAFVPLTVAHQEML